MKNEKEHTHWGIWIAIIIIFIITLTNVSLFQVGENKSTDQKDWEDCRGRVWEICGMTESVGVYNYILDLSFEGRINNTETDYLANFVSKTSTDCWEEFAEIVCDNNFNMNKIDTAQISIGIK